jgi:hypothetical protein
MVLQVGGWTQGWRPCSVKNSKEGKTGWSKNLVGYFKEGCGSKRAVLPMMMMCMEERPFEKIKSLSYSRNSRPITEYGASLLSIDPINDSHSEPADTDSKPSNPIYSERPFMLPLRHSQLKESASLQKIMLKFPVFVTILTAYYWPRIWNVCRVIFLETFLNEDINIFVVFNT